jgi:hypothetical protein
MNACHVQRSAAIELYFYGELAGAERDAVERHVAGCAECRRALADLETIRALLAERMDVSAPPGQDWSGFMTRLQDALRSEAASHTGGARVLVLPARRRRTTALAAAALLALVTITVLTVLRNGGDLRTNEPVVPPAAATAAPSLPEPVSAGADRALVQVSEQHFEKSKLVVLGLATRDAANATPSDWEYERTLATSLLQDTRLYRQAAEERGLQRIADVMRDLELVLLQTSMSESPDADSLAQLQRLIRRRDLITKMDAVDTAGS